MTFGQTLKQMLSLSGVKMAHLAQALGYDTSYVSRWINDIKVPSLRNNSDLIPNISKYVLENCDELGKARLKRVYGDGVDLEQALGDALRAAYNGSAPIDKMLSPVSSNATYLPGSAFLGGYEIYRRAVSHAARMNGGEEVNIIVTMPLGDMGNKDPGFFNYILADRDGSGALRVRMHQLVDMKAFAENIDAYCAAVCTFSCYMDNIAYEFYECDDSMTARGHADNIMMIEDKFLYQSIDSPFFDAASAWICYDTNALSKSYLLAMSTLSLCPKLIVRFQEDALFTTPFLYQYIMSGDIRYFLTSMHPIYFEDGFAEEMVEKYCPEVVPESFYLRYETLCAKAEKDVVLYTSALLDYIYTGRIQLFGRILVLSAEDRAKHLNQMITAMEKGRLKLTLLRDENPLLNRSDVKLSFYLSNKMGFMATESGSVLQLRSQQAIKHFIAFFSHFQQLDPLFCMTGADTTEFIRRGLSIIGG